MKQQGFVLIITLIMLSIVCAITLQNHQIVLAQLAIQKFKQPVLNREWILSCRQGTCEGEGWHVKIDPLFESNRRQFFNATVKACKSKHCNTFRQVFSHSSAILIEVPDWHAYQQLE